MRYESPLRVTETTTLDIDRYRAGEKRRSGFQLLSACGWVIPMGKGRRDEERVSRVKAAGSRFYVSRQAERMARRDAAFQCRWYETSPSSVGRRRAKRHPTNGARCRVPLRSTPTYGWSLSADQRTIMGNSCWRRLAPQWSSLARLPHELVKERRYLRRTLGIKVLGNDGEEFVRTQFLPLAGKPMEVDAGFGALHLQPQSQGLEAEWNGFGRLLRLV